jgi:hypothetical protein
MEREFMRRVLLAASLVLCGAIVSAQTRSADERTVRITAQQVKASPPTYVFLVTNLSQVPLDFVLIGGGATGWPKAGEDVLGILAGSMNTPAAMTVPIGWEAKLTESGGTGFFSYWWKANDRSKVIGPGESRCDFRVQLPVFEPPPKPLYADGVLYAQTDFRVRFRVIWPDGEQTTGVVGVDGLPKK